MGKVKNSSQDIEWTQEGWGPTACKVQHGRVELSTISQVSHASSSGEMLKLRAPLQLCQPRIHLTSFTRWILPGLHHLSLLVCFCVLLSMQPEKQKTGVGLGMRLGFLHMARHWEGQGEECNVEQYYETEHSEWRRWPWEADQQKKHTESAVRDWCFLVWSFRPVKFCNNTAHIT